MKGLLLGIGFVALAVAGGLSLLASEAPDGLEHSMHEVGAESGQPVLAAPMPDYQVGFLANPLARQALAGLSGALAVMGLAVSAGWLLRRRRSGAD
jgi:hypothetical protein